MSWGGDCRFGAMGHSHGAVIKGPTALRGAEISVPDLRAGFTYLIAAVCAEGRSVIRGVEELDRGYEDIDKSLRELGAQIERKQD